MTGGEPPQADCSRYQVDLLYSFATERQNYFKKPKPKTNCPVRLRTPQARANPSFSAKKREDVRRTPSLFCFNTLFFLFQRGIITMLHKLNNENQRYFSFLREYYTLFLSIIIYKNLAKARIPRSDYGHLCLDSLQFVQQQSGFAFFGALTSVSALFIFIIWREQLCSEKFLQQSQLLL